MPDQLDLVLRLLLAAGLAGVLGIERELTEQPAGFRTHILVGLGAALFAEISAYGFLTVAAEGAAQQVRADVTRVASQIVVGIGFLGGGAIIKYGATVRGLTTAASLWVTAAVGTAIGLGALILGAATTAITLVALVGLRPLRRIVRRYATNQDEFVILTDRSADLEPLVATVRNAGATLVETRITEEDDERTVHLTVRLPRSVRAGDLAAEVARLDHVRNVDWIH